MVWTSRAKHHAEERFSDASPRDMRYHRQIDGSEHGLARPIVDHFAAKHHLLATLRNDAKA